MAEERIGIKVEIYNPCGECVIKDKCEKNKDPEAFLSDPHSCFQYKLLNRLPTKEEAIEKMGLAIKEILFDTEQKEIEKLEEEHLKEGYKEYIKWASEKIAEAALNALLGE